MVINDKESQIGQIRDIIFGKEMNQLEMRFSQIEKQIKVNLTKRNNELEAKTKDLEENIITKTAELDVKLNQHSLEIRNLLEEIIIKLDDLSKSKLDKQELKAILRGAANKL